MSDSSVQRPKGRFAPSPSGRMHLGNIFTALVSWLSVKSRSGSWVLRIEDLDPQRSKLCHARMIEDDLHWLGLDWDEGGLDDIGPAGPYSQSRRGDIYEGCLARLKELGLVYPCTCTRADIMATQAPHLTDGRVVYSGRCRPVSLPAPWPDGARGAARVWVPDREIPFTDIVFGPQSVNLTTECGDFVVRRADGAWAYQLAVTADDAMMGVTEVVRGTDLLRSSAIQIYLQQLLGFPRPAYMHLPLLCNAEGRRLSKRDSSMSMEELRRRHTPESLIGRLAWLAGIIDEPAGVSPRELAEIFTPASIRPAGQITVC